MKNEDLYSEKVFKEFVKSYAQRKLFEYLTKRQSRYVFKFFFEKCFKELNPGYTFIPNWHIDAMMNLILRVNKRSSIKDDGGVHKIIINIPPRYMKSQLISVFFPAWILGIDPSKRVIVASYNRELAVNFSLQTKQIMNSRWYKNMFPETAISSKLNTKTKFATTKNGFRFATSIGGTLTGEGADVIIVDDPHKPNDVLNKKSRQKVCSWFENTLMSRLNDKKNGLVLLVMQRLHKEDLTGYLTEERRNNFWNALKLEAISRTNDIIHCGKFYYQRSVSEPLNKFTEGKKELKNIKQDLGNYNFQIQYQQNPISDDTSIVKRSWVKFFESKEFILSEYINKSYITFISIDSAIKSGEKNDYSAITIWFKPNDDFSNSIYLNEIHNVKLDYPSLIRYAKDLLFKHKPDFVIIEDAASGSQMLQELKKDTKFAVVPIKPTKSKVTRMVLSSFYFEQGLVKIRSDIEYLRELKEQLFNFPNVANDDICDSISMFINWYYQIYDRFVGAKKKQPNLRVI